MVNLSVAERKSSLSGLETHMVRPKVVNNRLVKSFVPLPAKHFKKALIRPQVPTCTSLFAALVLTSLLSKSNNQRAKRNISSSFIIIIHFLPVILMCALKMSGVHYFHLYSISFVQRLSFLHFAIKRRRYSEALPMSVRFISVSFQGL